METIEPKERERIVARYPECTDEWVDGAIEEHFYLTNTVIEPLRKSEQKAWDQADRWLNENRESLATISKLEAELEDTKKEKWECINDADTTIKSYLSTISKLEAENKELRSSVDYYEKTVAYLKNEVDELKAELLTKNEG